MKNIRSKRIILIVGLLAFVVLLLNSNTAFAAINTEYSGTDTVTDTNLDNAFTDSNLLELLAKLIYAVGRLLEWILGAIFSMLTGSSDFPWADKIVFNAVPLLDVNFINPDASSFVGNANIRTVFKNLYSTILAIAVTFFGIVVLITAIKLVISTIASEKAKYKQAIVDWLVGFVMLFCIHYAISFIFYLNEQLVVVASKTVKAQFEGLGDNIAKAKWSTSMNILIDNVRSTGATYNGQDVATIFQNNDKIIRTWQKELVWSNDSKGLTEGFMKDMRCF